jgi:hypothetical protein
MKDWLEQKWARQMPSNIENIVLDAVHRVQNDAWVFYSWLLPQQEAPKRDETHHQLVNWTLGVVDLPYFGETPTEVVLFVGSAIGFRIYIIWRYYFGGSLQSGAGKKKNGAGARSIQEDWRHCRHPPQSPSNGLNGQACRGNHTKAVHTRSRWWSWWRSSRGSVNGTTPLDDRPSLEPDARATQYGSYRDPSLAAFMSTAQERKSQLRHVPDPEVLRRKKLQAIRTKGKAKPQGPLGLTDHLLRNKRSSLRETVWDTSTYDNIEP